MSVDPVVYLHIGAPKTGTTYLQKVMAANRSTLRNQGLLYPGARADHFLAAQDVMGHAFRGHQDERAAGTWNRLLREIDKWQQSTLISHELFCLAQEDQINRILEGLAGRDVRVIVTVRDLARQIPAVWQEDLKNGKVISLPDFSLRVQENASKNQVRGFWGYQDVPRILARWESRVAPQHIYVVTVPPTGAQPDLLWSRFAQILAIELPQEQLQVSSTNVSLGAAEAEFLRRLNMQVAEAMPWPHYREQVKNGLVRRALAKRVESRPLALPSSAREWAAQRSQAMAAALGSHGYEIIGDLGDLSVMEAVDQADIAQPMSESDIGKVGVTAVADLLLRPRRDKRTGAGRAPSRRWLEALPRLRHIRGGVGPSTTQAPGSQPDKGSQ